MMQATRTAGTGLSAQQTRLDTIANNIANINTDGFKSTEIQFKDALYTTMVSPVEADNDNALTKGTGLLIGSTYKDFSQGTTQQTGNNLDLALEGDGFFTLETDTGEEVYTRNGQFAISSEEDGSYLVNSNGYYVLDTDGNHIPVSDSGGNFSVASDGTISDNGQEIGQLNVVTFENPQGLEETGKGNYRVSANSGTASASDATVVQGSLETSNVDLAQEMTLMIRTQRAFSLTSRALTTADEMDGLANNMRS